MKTYHLDLQTRRDPMDLWGSDRGALHPWQGAGYAVLRRHMAVLGCGSELRVEDQHHDLRRHECKDQLRLHRVTTSERL